MRIIGSLDSEKKALDFSHFLKRQGIDHQIDVKINKDWGSPDYGITNCDIWIHEEDQFPEALKWYNQFLENPDDPLFAPPQPPSKESPGTISIPPLGKRSGSGPTISNQIAGWEKQPMGWMTRSILIICALLLFFSELLTPLVTSNANTNWLNLYTSPVDKPLLYDFPYRYELIERYIQLYGSEEANHPLPPESKVLLNKIQQTPVWQGIYPILLNKRTKPLEEELNEAPLFEKIRQGQIWRLFTPALLHADIFHLFFNMIWLIVLGKQIEQRLSPLRYLLFLLFLGIFSNTVQYLASGPNFVGFSGILCGMLTFIWTRQKLAPWEGYQLNRMTYLFMIVFILGMASIQFLSFFIEKSLSISLAPNIANAAHLSGALLGFLLGRINLFNWRHS